MRALLLLLAISLSSPSFAAAQPCDRSEIRSSLLSLNRDLNSYRDNVRYQAARRFFAGVRGLKEQNPAGLNRGDDNYSELRNLVETLHALALDDQDHIRVYAIKSLRRVISLDLLPDPADRRLILEIWLDILRIADDPKEPKPVRLAASGH